MEENGIQAAQDLVHVQHRDDLTRDSTLRLINHQLRTLPVSERLKFLSALVEELKYFEQKRNRAVQRR